MKSTTVTNDCLWQHKKTSNPLSEISAAAHWALQRLLTNHFAPQQKLISKTRNGAKIIKKYDVPKTPLQRVLGDLGTVDKSVKTQLVHQNEPLNPAAIQRQIQALTEALLIRTTSKQGPKPKPSTRAS